jgi:hypothetical protein
MLLFEGLAPHRDCSVAVIEKPPFRGSNSIDTGIKALHSEYFNLEYHPVVVVSLEACCCHYFIHSKS